MEIASLNFLAIVAASLLAFVLGGLWYGPLFGKAWQKENGLSDEALAKSNLILIYGGAYVLAFVSALSLAMFIGKGDWSFGLFAGAMTGVFFVSTFLGILYLFERRSFSLFAINAGYCSLTFAAMGAVLGAWH